MLTSLNAGVSIIVSLLLRTLIGLHGYSGESKPPHFGDYEAQRHWMELTINLPIKDWYRNTSDNNLTYWGLDYPPLSAYQSWLCGKLLHIFEADAVALHSSRGYQTGRSKAWMRLSVIAFDILVFFPAIFAAAWVFNGKNWQRITAWPLLVALIQPAALLIDHGHFQYNNISLGLSAGAAAAIGQGWHLLGSSLFCLALNHKHMTLYYAPAFFAHLLGCCLQCKSAAAKVARVAKLGVVVITTFTICWLPYLSSWQAAQEVVQRLTPIDRGLFEDYVANFWCVSSLVIKWRGIFNPLVLVKLAAFATVAGCLPSMLQQLWRPSQKGLLYCMANTASSFYMFSYQVHEKSVLLPLLPISLLASHEPLLAFWFPVVACFSMYPLLKKDGLQLAYAATLLLWSFLQPRLSAESHRVEGLKSRRSSVLLKIVIAGSVICALGLHALDLFREPPERLKFLHDRLFVSFAFVHLAFAAFYLNFRQWQLPADSTRQQLKQE